MKIKVLFLITLICLCMTGCSSDLEEKRLEMVESNMRVDNIVTAYNHNKNVVENFDYDVEVVLNTDYEDFYTEIYDNACLDKYFKENVEYYSSILTLRGVIESAKNDFSYETYHFFEETTGNIEELTIVKVPQETYFMTSIWENAEIVEISLEKE